MSRGGSGAADLSLRSSASPVVRPFAVAILFSIHIKGEDTLQLRLGEFDATGEADAIGQALRVFRDTVLDGSTSLIEVARPLADRSASEDRTESEAPHETD